MYDNDKFLNSLLKNSSIEVKSRGFIRSSIKLKDLNIQNFMDQFDVFSISNFVLLFFLAFKNYLYLMRTINAFYFLQHNVYNVVTLKYPIKLKLNRLIRIFFHLL